jgi:hypothetical protein
MVLGHDPPPFGFVSFEVCLKNSVDKIPQGHFSLCCCPKATAWNLGLAHQEAVF